MEPKRAAKLNTARNFSFRRAAATGDLWDTAEMAPRRAGGRAFRIFAAGLRNANGKGLESTTGELWTVVNERDA